MVLNFFFLCEYDGVSVNVCVQFYRLTRNTKLHQIQGGRRRLANIYRFALPHTNLEHTHAHAIHAQIDTSGYRRSAYNLTANHTYIYIYISSSDVYLNVQRRRNHTFVHCKHNTHQHHHRRRCAGRHRRKNNSCNKIK